MASCLSGIRCASARRMRLLQWLALSFAPAAIGYRFPAPGYYARLEKPSWAPPGWLFGPVWTVLYALMGIAAWLVAGKSGSAPRTPLVLWCSQLGLNATWTPVFFGLRAPGLALVNIVLLWLALVATVTSFFSRRPVAGVLLLPYLGWVSFATALNFAIWRRNRLASPR
jgi:translocator protein